MITLGLCLGIDFLVVFIVLARYESRDYFNYKNGEKHLQKQREKYFRDIDY